jgi:hypothetical protein
MFLGLLAVTILSSCASERVKAELKSQKEHPEDYVYVVVTGSNVPVLVPKSQVPDKTPERETEAAQEALREIQQQSRVGPGDPEAAAARGR